jgi:2-polyprenyl-3-methyl-5-hydroxy-6-metoxy-1,4-benzoquinol methylase
VCERKVANSRCINEGLASDSTPGDACRINSLIKTSQYIIRGGIEDRERLRILARVMQSGTLMLFERLGLRAGQACIDVGCGGGDVTLEMARRVGPHGRVVGTDIDSVKIDLARKEAQQQGVTNVEFQLADVRDMIPTAAFDFLYARFLLTHLGDPHAAVLQFRGQLKRGGLVAIEDIDFDGHFSFPESQASIRYRELYCAAVRARGGDPMIGRRLPSLLQAGGFESLGVAITQPVGIEGEVKLIAPVTLQNIADAVVEQSLATHEEVDAIVSELFDLATDPAWLVSLPRIVQAWGRQPTA